MPFKVTQFEHGHIEADLFTEAIELPKGTPATACGVRVYVATGGWLLVEIITGLNETIELLRVDLGGYNRLDEHAVEIMAKEE